MTVHVVKVGDRYYLIGGGSAGVTHIADVPSDAVDPTSRRNGRRSGSIGMPCSACCKIPTIT